MQYLTFKINKLGKINKKKSVQKLLLEGLKIILKI